MSLIREVTTGWAKRIRLENSLALQAATYVRPAQIKLSVATVLNDISTQLDADAKLKKQFDSVKIVLPSND
jgi:hypothetical protein